jgi:hypothetical protein
VIGWFESISNPILSRILIFLTRGDKYIRWVAIKEAVTLRREEQGQRRYRREVMLRTMTCCEACALEYVASKAGNWVLIL